MKRRDFIRSTLIAGLVLVSGTGAHLLATQPAIIYADGKHGDSKGLQAWMEGRPVTYADGTSVGDVLYDQTFLLDEPVIAKANRPLSIYGCIFFSNNFRLPA